jgi:hypothetical protein
MKFESIFLTMLFVACSSVCVLVMGAMLSARPSSSQLANAPRAASAVAMQAGCTTPGAAESCEAPGA